MKNYLNLLLLLLASFTVNAQDISNSLAGYYKNNSNDGWYTSIHFNGKGHALVNDSAPAEYFQKGENVYVLVDNNVFILTLTKKELKGISTWVEKLKFKPQAVPTDDDYLREFNQYTIDPNLLYAYFLENFDEKTGDASMNGLMNPSEYTNSMEKLCDKDLTISCGALFGMISLEELGGMDALLSDSVKQIKENPKLEKLANKMIALQDFRGYGLLGSYYLMIGNETKAREIFDLGSENGDEKSSLAIFEMELNNINSEEE